MTSSAVNITQSPKKILVIKICCLGDIIFLTPSLRALRARFPSAHITLLTSSWVCPVAEQIPFINDILIFDAPLQQKLNSKGVAESFRLVRKLRKEKYDVVICGHRKKLFSMLGYYSRIPVRIGFADSHSRYITHPVMFRFDRHEIGRYCDLVNVLGVNTADMRTEIKPRFKDTKQIDDFISKIKIQPDDCLVGIMAGGGQNPGTSMHIKRWGADHYKELCKRILTDPKMKILLLGDSSDNELNETIRSGAGASPKNMLNIAGRLSLEALPSLLQKLQIVIGGDTGPAHIAAAVGTPTLFLFGPSDPRLVAPMTPNSQYLWKQIHCSPCYTPATVMQKKYFHGNEFFCLTATLDCLRKLTVDEVFAAFTNLIKQNAH